MPWNTFLRKNRPKIKKGICEKLLKFKKLPSYPGGSLTKTTLLTHFGHMSIMKHIIATMMKDWPKTKIINR